MRNKERLRVDDQTGDTRARDIEGQIADAEQLFRQTAAHLLTREERTTQVAKQIILEETERRHSLSETLRAARLERAGQLTDAANNQQISKPDQ